MSAPELNPIMWPCRTCHADRGEPCRTRSGARTRTHVDRHRIVAAWRRYGGDARMSTLGNGSAR
jgi:hypothetical protein